MTVSFLTIGFQTVVNAAAGLIRMPWVRYTIAMLIGCVAWALIYATVGIAAVEAGIALAAHSPWALVAACWLLRRRGVVVARSSSASRWRRRRTDGRRRSGPVARLECRSRLSRSHVGVVVTIRGAVRLLRGGLPRRIRLVAYGARLESVLG